MKTLTLQQQLGLAIRQVREETGHSQENFADHIGMNRVYYGAIERGRKNITIATLHRVAQGLGTRMADLLADVDG